MSVGLSSAGLLKCNKIILVPASVAGCFCMLRSSAYVYRFVSLFLYDGTIFCFTQMLLSPISIAIWSCIFIEFKKFVRYFERNKHTLPGLPT